MKADILLQKMLAQGDLQAVESKAKTDIKVLDDPKTFLKLALWQLIRIHWGILMTSISYQCKEQYIWTILKNYKGSTTIKILPLFMQKVVNHLCYFILLKQ